jgi:hypothetical protein
MDHGEISHRNGGVNGMDHGKISHRNVERDTMRSSVKCRWSQGLMYMWTNGRKTKLMMV